MIQDMCVNNNNGIYMRSWMYTDGVLENLTAYSLTAEQLDYVDRGRLTVLYRW